MFKDMPTYDWFHQFPGYKQSNYRMTTQYDTNGSKIDAKLCMDGWFVPSMPDLNQSNPLVSYGNPRDSENLFIWQRWQMLLETPVQQRLFQLSLLAQHSSTVR